MAEVKAEGPSQYGVGCECFMKLLIVDSEWKGVLSLVPSNYWTTNESYIFDFRLLYTTHKISLLEN